MRILTPGSFGGWHMTTQARSRRARSSGPEALLVVSLNHRQSGGDLDASAGPSQPLEPSRTAVSRDRHPVLTYLASLGKGSRRTMWGALEFAARLLSSGRADANSLPWHALRYEHVAAVRASMLEGFAPATTNKTLCAIRGVLKQCWRLGLVSADEREKACDVQAVRGFRLPSGRALNAGELRALFESCAADECPSARRDAALVAVLYGTGLRRSEAVALDLSDYSQSTGELKVRAGKGGKQRMAFITNGGREALSVWLAVRGNAPGPIFCPVGKGMFGRVAVRRLSTQAIYCALLRRSARAGITRFSPHDLRRSFVSDLLDNGADLVSVQALAGHASPTTTQSYDRRPDTVRRRAAELLHVPFVRRLEGRGG